MSRRTKAARLRARRAWDARAAFLRAASDRPPGPPSAAVMESVDAAWDRFRDTPGNRAHKRRVFGMARECLAALEAPEGVESMPWLSVLPGVPVLPPTPHPNAPP